MARTNYRIPFNRPCLTGKELDYITEAMNSGHISGDGCFTKRCNRLLEERLGARKCLITTSCTHALEMAGLLLGLEAGQEVVMPSYTFVSTVNAVMLRGARPVFVDIRPDTLNLDESLLEAALTERTRAIFVVHYGGVACEMDPILALASSRGLAVVEDAAQALGARYRGRWLGTLGELGCLSFHETKNILCGEGGALIINSSHHGERAEIIREKGTNRSQYFRGLVDKYTWVDVGSSYLPSDILAAFLLAQLEAMDQIQSRRKAVYYHYLYGLEGLEKEGLIRLPRVPSHVESNYHMFYILLEDEATRNRLMEHLQGRGILAVFHYVPLHLSPMGRRLGYREGSLPVTEDLSGRLLRLPFHNDLSQEDQHEVIQAIRDFF